ncbi:hypothetical protein [Roseivivax sp. CAU 1753]
MMTIYGVPVSDIEWTTWWMLGSAILALVGFLGWQIDKFFVGARVIAETEETTPRFDWVREKLLPGYLANRSFKRHVAGRQLQSRIGSYLFNLMILGLVSHIGFWIYAANFMAS